MSSRSSDYEYNFNFSGQDFFIDAPIKLESVDYELFKIAAASEDFPLYSEDLDPPVIKLEEGQLNAPNVWLPCDGLASDELDCDIEVKSEEEEEQMVCDWPRLESDWLMLEVRGSDWFTPPEGQNWQQQCFVDPLRHQEKPLESNTQKLLSQMKPCAVLLDSSAVSKYLTDQVRQLKNKIRKVKAKKSSKKKVTGATSIQVKSMSHNTSFLNLNYLKKSNPDFIYTDFSKSSKRTKRQRSRDSCVDSCNGSSCSADTASSCESTPTALYQCPYCLSLFFTEFEFRYHLSQKLLNNSKAFSIEAFPQLYECIDCLQIFDSHRKFNKHMETKHKSSVKCPICKERFMYVCQLNKHQHMSDHFQSTTIHCYTCDMEFPNSYCLESHKFFCHQSSYQCKTCGASFQNSKKLACHGYVLHGTPKSTRNNKSACLSKQPAVQEDNMSQLVEPLVVPFSNSELCETVSDVSDVTVGTSSWHCEKCNKDYKLVENFMSHWKKRHSSDPLPEWFSNLIFFANPDSAREVFISDLGVEVADATSVTSKSKVSNTELTTKHVLKLLPCKQCDKVYKSQNALDKHVTFAHAYQELLTNNVVCSGDVSCTLCAELFETDTLLYIHMVSKHHQHMKYECSYCNTSFETSALYTQHTNDFHDGVKMLICKICSAVFASSYYLSLHMTKKHNKKLLHCIHCKKDYSFKEYLQKHLSKCLFNKNNNNYKSTDVTAQGCPLCQTSCTAEGQLKLHIIEDHLRPMKKLVYCDICCNVFLSKYNLEQHLISIHSRKWPHWYTM